MLDTTSRLVSIVGPEYATKAEMTHSGVDHLGLTCCWTVPIAILRCAQVRSAFHNFTWDGHIGLVLIEAVLPTRATRFARSATGGFQQTLRPIGVPIVGPLPDIAGGVV